MARMAQWSKRNNSQGRNCVRCQKQEQNWCTWRTIQHVVCSGQWLHTCLLLIKITVILILCSDNISNNSYTYYPFKLNAMLVWIYNLKWKMYLVTMSHNHAVQWSLKKYLCDRYDRSAGLNSRQTDILYIHTVHTIWTHDRTRNNFFVYARGQQCTS